MADPNEPPADNANPELANTLFPPPPAYYKAFTAANVARFQELGGPSWTSKGRAAFGSGPDDEMVGRKSAEDEEEYAILEAQLYPPRADWVIEEGRWMSFGQQYSVESTIPTAADIGLPPWVDPSVPPQESLPPILHSFLHTLMALLDALTNTAQDPNELFDRGIAHVGDPYIQHLSNLAATMMVSANQLRGVQAEATLVLLMERQLAARKEQTEALREKCRTIASNIQALKQTSKAVTEQ